jgi:glycosyltransferase involved in cell wall biosynthesis
VTRVLIVEPAGRLWGSERALLDLIGAAKDLDIAVCCPPDSPLQQALEKAGTPVFPHFIVDLHQKSRWQRLRAAVGVFRAIRAFRPNVIHVNQAGAYRVVLPAATLLDLPIVCHVRIFDDAFYLAQRVPNPQRLVAIIAISGAVEKEIRRFRKLERIPVHLIYDGYARANDAGTPAVPEPRAEIACVGRIAPIKGVDVLIKALATGMLPANAPRCHIAGSGPESYVKELRALIAKNPSVRITWLGTVDNVLALLRRCRVLVCPSHLEPLGRVVLEAWDAGCIPVVFRGSGGAAEIVSASRGGIIYDRQTPQSLADAITRALQLSDRQCVEIVEKGRHWMVDHCNPETFGRAISRVLETSVRRQDYATSKAR